MKVILASSSPRRIELIKKLGCEVTTATPGTDETFDTRFGIEDNLISVSAAKALKVKKETDEDYDVIIGADTVVVLDDEVIGKPKDEDDAHNMLTKLSGRTHTVMTAVCILSKEKSLSFCEKTKVTFSQMSESEITGYINTREPFGKAGAYAVQGIAALYISAIEGCYYNVMGLPVNRIYSMLKSEFGFKL